MGLDIPAGEKAYTIKDSFTLPVDVEGLAGGRPCALPCQGYAGRGDSARRQQAVAALDQGLGLQLAGPVSVQEAGAAAEGTRIDVAITYDNSAENPRNPSHPPKRVKWGEQSFDEMGSVTLQVVPARQSDFMTLMAALQEKRVEAIKNAYKNRMAGVFGSSPAAVVYRTTTSRTLSSATCRPDLRYIS